MHGPRAWIQTGYSMKITTAKFSVDAYPEGTNAFTAYKVLASNQPVPGKRRKQIWEALHPEEKPKLEVAQRDPLQDVSHGGSRPHPLNFAAATAEAIGQSKATTNRAVARAEALGDEVLDKVVNTSLDSGVELDALAKMDAPERAVLVERAAAGEKVSARTPDAPVKPSNAPARNLPMRLYKAVHDMVHGLGFKDVNALIEAIAELPELTQAEQSTLDDALDIFLSIADVFPAEAKM